MLTRVTTPRTPDAQIIKPAARVAGDIRHIAHKSAPRSPAGQARYSNSNASATTGRGPDVMRSVSPAASNTGRRRSRSRASASARDSQTLMICDVPVAVSRPREESGLSAGRRVGRPSRGIGTGRSAAARRPAARACRPGCRSPPKASAIDRRAHGRDTALLEQAHRITDAQQPQRDPKSPLGSARRTPGSGCRRSRIKCARRCSRSRSS